MAISINNNAMIIAANANNGDSLTGRIKIKKIVWANGTTAAHDVVLKDGAGTVIWRASIAEAGDTVIDETFDFRSFDGIETDTIDSGDLLIYLA